ncbi:MAG: 30S ribosome-binding factor RbfA [Candidatus Omnitrophota bacterium]
MRRQKIIAAIKREISNIVHEELKDSRLGFVTIMRVDITADLKNAWIYFSVLGDEAERKSTQEALENAKSFIRRLIGQKIKLRFTPKINFKLDRTPEHSIKIQQELDKIKEEDERKKSH